MVMFSTFEHSVHFLYYNVIKSRRDDCSKAQQLGVTCLAGYAAGSIGSFISNPADNIVACLYNKKADTLTLVPSLDLSFLTDTFGHIRFTFLFHIFRLSRKLGLSIYLQEAFP